jgi:hypothetical protein
MVDATSGWDNSGYVVPHSAGVVRMEVTIFPNTVPIRSRIRQHYAYQFNSFTLSQVQTNDIKFLETVDDGNASIGITFKKNVNYFHTVCGFLFSNEVAGVSSDVIESSSGSVTRDPSYVPRLSNGRWYSDDGADSCYPTAADLVKMENQIFILSGSLFSADYSTVLNVFKKYNTFSDSDTSSLFLTAKGKFFASLVPQARTWMKSESITTTVKKLKNKNPNEYWMSIADSEMINGDPNGADFHNYSQASNFSNDQGLSSVNSALDISDAKFEEVDQTVQQLLGYVGIEQVISSNIVEEMKKADIVFERSPLRGIKLNKNNASLDTERVPAYVGLPPGVHASFYKANPIFPGEDFTFRFHKTAQSHSKAIIESPNDEVRYAMQESYKYIDSGCTSADNEDNGTLTPNFGVCRPTFIQNKNGKFNVNRIVSKNAKDYYLADQSYVAIEIDGGVENRYFLIIPERGTVIMIEITADAEICDVVDNDQNLAKFLDFSGMRHSRLLFDFGISGSSLLNQENFSIHFQHFRGILRVTFESGTTQSFTVSRQRFTKDIYGLKENILLYNFLDDKNPFKNNGTFLDHPALKDKLSSEKFPIKLSGNLIVHMGHIRAAFNFSPITYPSTTSLNISYPVGISNLEGNDSAVNILLRSSGGYEEGSGRNSFSDLMNKYFIKNENGKIVPGQSKPYYTHCSSQISEVIGGSLVNINSDLFSANQKMCITGPSLYNDKNWPFYLGEYSDPSSIAASYRLTDKKEFVNRVHPSITLKSGSITFKGSNGSLWLLEGATRPICDGFSVFVPEGIKPQWKGVAADVTVNVMEFSDSWDRSDRSFMQHSGNIKFYLNKADALPLIENITSVQTEKGSLLDGARKADRIDVDGISRFGEFQGDQTPLLASLQDKYFYVEVRAWRDPYKVNTFGAGLNAQNTNNGPSVVENAFYATHENGIPDEDNTLLFTGFCRSSSYSIKDTHIEMSCKLEDYWSILSSMTWLNAPFYDAMRDYDAVFDVMQRAGFFYERSSRDPAYLIHKYVSTPSDSDYYEIPYDGDVCLANDYVLPGSYGTMDQPILKPNTGDYYADILKKFATISGKFLYFDRRGVMHFDIPSDEMEIMQITSTDPSREIYQAPPSHIFSHTYSSPDQDLVPWWNVITDTYNFQRKVEDIVNEIRVVSSTPNGSLVTAAHMNRASLSDIGLPGFIGFRKMFLQKSGYFGSGEAVRKQVERYTTMFNAPVVANFSILGRVGLQAGQIILIDGPGISGAYRLLLTNVSNTISPRDNSWVSSVSGRYFLPGEKIKFTGTTLTLGTGGGGT